MTRAEARHHKARFWGHATVMHGAARVSVVHRYPDDPQEGPTAFGLLLESEEWEVTAWSNRAADQFYDLLVQQEEAG